MRIGILGTGMVGMRLADGFTAKGHEVRMGAREPGNAKAAEWAAATGGAAGAGTFAEVADWAEIVVLAVVGERAAEAVRLAGGDRTLGGKIVIDVTNPLDFSKGFPPTLTAGLNNTSSAGEAVQAAAPKARVVKTLNTVSNTVMTDPDRLAEPTDLFLCGNDTAAKAEVAGLLAAFGWRAPIDLGGIEASRGTEAWLLLWTRLFGAFGTPDLNIRVVRARADAARPGA
jgi:8-hydroxy-5-deazaflavin:NADPH oxidoreductase